MITAARDPAGIVRDMITAGNLSRVIQIAVRLGVPDLVAEGSRTEAELAVATGTHDGALERLMRVLAANDLCAKHEGGIWKLTALGETLRSDSPAACHGAALYLSLIHI